MATPFDGLTLFVFQDFWGGTSLTPADAEAYVKAGVTRFAIKCSDGVTGATDYVSQTQIVGGAGGEFIPWAYIEPNLDLSPQLETAWKASGEPPSGSPLILDIEAMISVPALRTAIEQHSPIINVVTWGDPSAHPNAPSIGELCDIHINSIAPETYYSAWQVTPQVALQRMFASYKSLGIPASLQVPLIPAIDGPEILTSAQVAKSMGFNGLMVFRHGANGIIPSSFDGAAAVFKPTPVVVPPPTPSYTTLSSGTYLVPAGAKIIID